MKRGGGTRCVHPLDVVDQRLRAVRLAELTNDVRKVDKIIREVAGEVTNDGRYVEVCGDGEC
jgi:hypothetical protein